MQMQTHHSKWKGLVDRVAGLHGYIIGRELLKDKPLSIAPVSILEREEISKILKGLEKWHASQMPLTKIKQVKKDHSLSRAIISEQSQPRPLVCGQKTHLWCS